MPATFNIPVVDVEDDDLITAALWEGEFENIYNNFTPAGMDDYSASESEMQTATDPYPASVVSRPTSLQGELERMRYVLAQLSGKTYWYQDPDVSLATLSGERFASGTAMVFYQAAAPTGWTKSTSQNDKALRVVSGTGGGSGGTHAISSGLSHSHTVNSHTHDLANHTHSTPSHTHDLDRGGGALAGTAGASSQQVNSLNSSGSQMYGTLSSGASDYRGILNRTETSGSGTSGTPSNNTSGAAAPGTDTQAPVMAYIDVIVCTKD